jgi:REP element-mobilizing transposase RayT
LNDNGCPCLRIGGVEDHVHFLFVLSRTLSLAKIVETLKTSSSKWLKTKDPILGDFHWQGGYGAFSVSPSAMERVILYIDGQGDHHRRVTFQEELRAFLVRHRVAYDERFLWD